MNKYIDVIISQNTTQFMHNMYNIFHNYMFRPIYGTYRDSDNTRMFNL